MVNPGMSIEAAKAELLAAMSGPAGRNWGYTPAVSAVLIALEQTEQRNAKMESQFKAQAPVLPEGVPDELRDEIIDLCDGYEIGDFGAQEIWTACRAAMLQSFGNSEQLPEPVSPPYKLVGEVVAWDHPTKERSVDFRWLDYDVAPGTQLYAILKESE